MEFEYNVEKQEITVELNTPSITLDIPTGGRGLKGDTGDKGDKGDKGDTGDAATVVVGSTTTGDAGTSASVSNSGTASAAVLDFTIPKGDKGDTGAAGQDGQDGADGVSPIITTSKVDKTTTITITDADGTKTATILDGEDGTSTWGSITGTLSDQTDLQNALDSKANTSDIPTKVSDLQNDSGFIDNTVNNLTNYYTSSNTYTKTEVDSLIATVSSLNIEVVQTLPTENISTSTIYLVPNSSQGTNNYYDEYIYVSDSWELIGSTQVDLSNYYTKTETDSLLNAKADTSSLSTVATSGDYEDLSNTPTIPTKTSDLTNDSNFITSTEASDTYALKSLYGDTTINVGRKADTTVGNNSTAEGYHTTASGHYSHAEGCGPVASGMGAHAEGYDSTASGNYSHAEGVSTKATGLAAHAEGNSTTTSGDYSHSEGLSTTASGMGAHAEGYDSTASGRWAHAEGASTTASGEMSHAEGSFTVAKGENQHVSGKYNIVDYNNNYAEIIGNGTADDARSNARTLDWSGNEVLAGKLTLGAGPTNNLDAATKLYVDNAISSSSTADVYYVPASDSSSSNPFILENHNPGVYVFEEYGNVYIKVLSTSSTQRLTYTPWAGTGFYLMATPSSAMSDGDIIAQYMSFGSTYPRMHQVTYNSSDSDNFDLSTITQYGLEWLNRTSAQTISGLKTFTTLPQSSVVPTDDKDLVNKKYVDDSAGGGGTATDVKINGTTITSNNEADIITEGTYDSSTNKIATMDDVPTKVSELSNDSGYITSYTETDPIYSASAAANITSTDITNWNNKSDFSGDYDDLTNKPTIPDELADLSEDTTHRVVTDTEKVTWNAKSDFSGSYTDLTDKPTIPTVPTTLSSFTDDLGSSPVHTHSQYLTSYTETDPVFTASAAAGITSSDISNWNSKANEGITTLTGSTINIWELSQGLYRLPTSSTVYYDPNNTISGIGNKDYLFVKYNGSFMIIGNDNINIYQGSASSTADSGTIKRLITDDDIIDNLNSTVISPKSALSAYQGYLLNENKQDKITSTNKLDYSLLSNTPTIPTVPTNVSAFTNDSGYVTDAVTGDLTSLSTTDQTDLVSAVNEVNAKNIIAIGLASNTNVSSSATWTHYTVPIDDVKTTIGDKLSFNSSTHRVIVGDGVSYVKINAYTLLRGITSGIEFNIRKNGTGVISLNVQPRSTSIFENAAAYLIVPVTSGDYFDFTIRTGATGTITIAGGSSTAITFEAMN